MDTFPGKSIFKVIFCSASDAFFRDAQKIKPKPIRTETIQIMILVTGAPPPNAPHINRTPKNISMAAAI
jgi:hypothetical protein